MFWRVNDRIWLEFKLLVIHLMQINIDTTLLPCAHWLLGKCVTRLVWWFVVLSGAVNNFPEYHWTWFNVLFNYAKNPLEKAKKLYKCINGDYGSNSVNYSKNGWVCSPILELVWYKAHCERLSKTKLTFYKLLKDVLHNYTLITRQTASVLNVVVGFQMQSIWKKIGSFTQF